MAGFEFTLGPLRDELWVYWKGLGGLNSIHSAVGQSGSCKKNLTTGLGALQEGNQGHFEKMPVKLLYDLGGQTPAAYSKRKLDPMETKGSSVRSVRGRGNKSVEYPRGRNSGV